MKMQAFKDSLESFCQNYRGSKLCINTRNVGHSLSHLVHIRGGNRVLHSIHIHYADTAFEQEVDTIQTIEHAEVCKEVAAMLSIQARKHHGFDLKCIGLVGKLSTSKYDRDNSEAFISVDENIYHLKLNKLELEDYIIVQREENIPLLEDYAISQAVISIVTNGIESMPELGNGFMKKISLVEEQ